ncbi:MAG: hypothetical protein JXR60_11525 [Bacteroidales bacterium]|nr:hypothetical protein [Bacteroidales bacterium]
MFKAGQIIYFTPFYFENGKSGPKDKYFVVLENSEDDAVLASLPTRRNFIPDGLGEDTGCVEVPEINLNCYKLCKGQVITTNGKSFGFDTHLYGRQIRTYTYSWINDIYPNYEVDYIIWGELLPDIFEKLKACFRESDMVKNKYKRMLKS